MQRAATFCISGSREKSAAKTRRGRKTPSRCVPACWTVCGQPSTSDSSTSHLSMTFVAFFASPFTSQPDVCHKLSQTFGVDEAALQEDFIDFKIVPGLKEQFLAAKDIVLFWATKVPIRFLGLQKNSWYFSVARGHVVTRIWILRDKSHQELTSVPVDGQAIG